jgi:hypothetical protein
MGACCDAARIVVKAPGRYLLRLEEDLSDSWLRSKVISERLVLIGLSLCFLYLWICVCISICSLVVCVSLCARPSKSV